MAHANEALLTSRVQQRFPQDHAIGPTSDKYSVARSNHYMLLSVIIRNDFIWAHEILTIEIL
jgi:hypothetical protein